MSAGIYDLILSPDELHVLTGFRQVAKQLPILHRAGFSRARITHGRLILERDHYKAVCAGEKQERRPQVRMPTLKAA